MSKIPLKYHINVLFYTKYTHPTLICRGADGRTTHGRTDGQTDGHTDTRKIFTQYTGISSCSQGRTYRNGPRHINQIKSVKPPDVGFLCVSQKVHTEDTTDNLALAVVHRNGPRHINQIKSVKPTDVGFLCVSQKVHTEDTTDDLALALVHRNGPRHINQIKSVKPLDVGFLCVSQKVH